MSKSDARAEAAALREAAMEDILSLSEAELRQEAAEDGEDIGGVGSAIKAKLRDAAAKTQREKLAAARAAIAARPRAAPSARRLSIESIKRLVSEAFAAKPALGMAFREGKAQSDADWESAYEDLVALGEIPPDADD